MRTPRLPTLAIAAALFTFGAAASWAATDAADQIGGDTAGRVIGVRTGNHPGLGRVVFDLPAGEKWTLDQQGDTLTARFADAAPVGGATPPHNVRSLTVDAREASIQLTPGAQVRSVDLGNRLVIDVLDPHQRGVATPTVDAGTAPAQIEVVAPAPRALAASNSQPSAAPPSPAAPDPTPVMVATAADAKAVSLTNSLSSQVAATGWIGAAAASANGDQADTSSLPAPTPLVPAPVRVPEPRNVPPPVAASPPAPAPAPAPPASALPTNGGLIVLDAGAGRVFRTRGTISSLFAADPKIVEVRPASHNSVFIFGVGPGRSTVAALDEGGDTLTQFDVIVRPSGFGASESSGSVRHQVPDANVQFSETPNTIVVTGQVPNGTAAQQVDATARGFLSDKQTVDNRTTISSPVQVTLRVRIAEIARSITRQLGINWTALANFGHFNASAAVIDGLTQTNNLPNTIGGGFNDGTSSINTVLDLLAQDQLITILAEPNLTARSGESASFLAGGEYPIPTAGSNGQVTVSFKQYGISLAFVPTVLTSGRISLHVHPEVSELTTVGAVTVPISTGIFGSSTVTIPAITVRRADTTVELGTGQSFAVAGLLQAANTLNSRGLPYLGDIPILGPLFKSDLFQRNESELVIVVTPYVVRPVGSPDQLSVPTDGYVPPGDLARVGFGRQRAFGTDPPAVIIPSTAALAQSVRMAPSDLPSGVGFVVH